MLPLDLQTVDNWGTNVLDSNGIVQPNNQCIIPGWNLYQFPTTYSMSNVCDQKVIQLDLVNSQDISQVVGIVYIFKDYSDQLYLTVSLNATYSAVASAPLAGVAGNVFQGQYRHAQPPLDTDTSTAGSLWLWDQPTFTPPKLSAAYNNMLLSAGSGSTASR